MYWIISYKLTINVSNYLQEYIQYPEEGLATLLEGAGLAFDIQKCSKFQKSNMMIYDICLASTGVTVPSMVVLKL